MIKEAYCSFEVAMLLKEKGFEQVGCQKQYNTSGDLCEGFCYGPVAPTHQMAMRFLREVHGLHIEILAAYHFRCFDGYSFEVYNINEGEFINYASDKGCFKTNEEAAEEALKYCLENLI